MIKLIAFDLDGTILNRHSAISEKDRLTLRTLNRGGKLIVIASGRMTESIRNFSKALGIDTPVVAYNGAMVRDSFKRGNRMLRHIPLHPKYGDYLIDYCAGNNYRLNYYLDDTLYSDNKPYLRMYSRLYTNQTKSKYRFIPDLKCFKGKNPTKLIIITSPKERDRLYGIFHTKFGDEINVVRTNPEYLEFMDKKADKGSGLRAVARAYGIKRSEILAFGDADNDLEMLEYAGTGVAVANANSRVKAVADHVSGTDNNHNPITETIRELVS